MSRTPLLVYFGHHKCASTWISQIIGDIARSAGWRMQTLHSRDDFNNDLNAHINNHGLEFVSLTNAKPDYVDALPPFRGFHVIRDPRDIVVSGYFSHLKTHPPSESWQELEAYRATLQALPQDRGLRREIANDGFIFRDMAGWDYAHDDILELRMESFVRAPYQTFLRIFRFLGMLEEKPLPLYRRLQLPLSLWLNRHYVQTQGRTRLRQRLPRIPAWLLLRTVWEHRYEVKSGGRAQGEESAESHYRKGVAGDWRNYFTEEHRAFFKERYPGLVVKLGYETSADW